MGAIKTSEEMSMAHQQQEGRTLTTLRKLGLTPEEQKDEERLGLTGSHGIPVIQPNTLDNGKVRLVYYADDFINMVMILGVKKCNVFNTSHWREGAA